MMNNNSRNYENTLINKYRFVEEGMYLRSRVDRNIYSAILKNRGIGRINFPVPKQGITLFITATSVTEYELILTTLIPKLVKCGALFQVVRPYWAERCLKEDGKMITIFPSMWNAEKFFSDSAVKFLLSDKLRRNIEGTVCLQGLLHARFGRTRPSKMMIVTDYRFDKSYIDDRHHPYPRFVKSLTLSDYIRQCESREPEKVLPANLAGACGFYRPTEL